MPSAAMVRSPDPEITPWSVATAPFCWNVLSDEPEGVAKVQLLAKLPLASTVTVPPVRVVLQGLVIDVIMPVSSTLARAS